MNVTLQLTDEQVEVIAQRVAELVDDRQPAGWLTVAQASELWGIKPSGVRQKARRRQVESRKEGRALLVRRSLD